VLGGLWPLALVVTGARFYGTWLFSLCNNTQHVGLQDNVPDFRLCCRTIELNPFVRFLSFQMNYHTEHHMYAAVPCYNLHRLHEAIRHEMPPTTRGLVAAWKEVLTILKRQKEEPGYQHVYALPAKQ
jgi:fatty acid desaturase